MNCSELIAFCVPSAEFRAGRMPPSTAGRDACRHDRHGLSKSGEVPGRDDGGAKQIAAPSAPAVDSST